MATFNSPADVTTGSLIRAATINDLDADWAEVARTENNEPIDTYDDQQWMDYCNSTGDWK